MNPRVILSAVIAIPVLVAGFFIFLQRSERGFILNPTPKEIRFPTGRESKRNMTIASPAFDQNSIIPSQYTCDGDNVNPPLEIRDIPEGAKSLALIMDDPDAPRGTWVHWTIWNITPHVSQIPKNSVPNMAPWDTNSPMIPLPAIQGITSFGKPGYGGPCPHSGTHRYFFKLYALDVILDLSLQADKAALEEAMEGHILDKIELVGLYSHK